MQRKLLMLETKAALLMKNQIHIMQRTRAIRTTLHHTHLQDVLLELPLWHTPDATDDIHIASADGDPK